MTLSASQAGPGPVLVEVERGGVVESVHTGHLVVLGPRGDLVLERGRPDLPVFWRSAAKPLQAAAVLSAGVTLTQEQLAMAAASHAGEPVHVEVVTSTLADGGLDESDLGCPPAWPLDPAAFAAAYEAGQDGRRIFMNCSGKHAALLRACQQQGWPTAGYLDPDHPLQHHLRDTLEQIAGEKIAASTVDGCGLPLHALSLRGLARSFRELRESPVAEAMRARPVLVDGTGRFTTRVLAGVTGVLAKNGAEGVFAAALPGGAAFAVKIDDGAVRAAEVVAGAVFAWLGADGDLPPSTQPVLGGADVVGSVRVRAGLLDG
ncbi:asparaginase [Jatrophihabitans sp. YIM 134969]